MATRYQRVDFSRQGRQVHRSEIKMLFRRIQRQSVGSLRQESTPPRASHDSNAYQRAQTARLAIDDLGRCQCQGRRRKVPGLQNVTNRLLYA